MSKITLRTEVVAWETLSGGTPLLEGFLLEKSALLPFCPPPLSRFGEAFAPRKQFINAICKRNDLAGLLELDLKRWNAPHTSIDNCRHLREENTFAIVAGQQAGLLTGPIYTFYKAIGAILLADHLNNIRPEKFVPAFWMASEDHDLDEVRWIEWLDTKGSLARFESDLSSFPEGTTAASVPVDRYNLEAFFSWRQANQRETEYAREMDVIVREAVEKSRSWSDVCARLLLSLFGNQGLLILDSANAGLRRMAAPIFAKEIQQPLSASEEIHRAAKGLNAADFNSPLHRQADRCSFFVMENGLRTPVSFDGAKFHMGERTLTAREMEDLAVNNPELFSPSAALRPIVQDFILPTAATVLGPGEVGYHSQIGGIYERHGVPRPCGVLRPGLTIIESAIARRMKKHGLAWRDAKGDADALAKRLTASPELETLKHEIEQLRSQLDRSRDAIAMAAAGIDQELSKPVGKDLQAMTETLNHIEILATRKLAQKDEKVHEDIRLIQTCLFPGDDPQERRLNGFYFLYKYGPDFLDTLIEALRETSFGKHGVAEIS